MNLLKKRNLGFTIIEAVLTMAILSFGVLGVMTLYQQNVARSSYSERTLKATLLAQQKMEQIVHDKTYNGYSYLVSGNYTSPEDLTAAGYAGYTRTITFANVNANTLNDQVPNAGYRRVTVAVAISGGETVSLTTLVTDW